MRSLTMMAAVAVWRAELAGIGHICYAYMTHDRQLKRATQSIEADCARLRRVTDCRRRPSIRLGLGHLGLVADTGGSGACLGGSRCRRGGSAIVRHICYKYRARNSQTRRACGHPPGEGPDHPRSATSLTIYLRVMVRLHRCTLTAN